MKKNSYSLSSYNFFLNNFGLPNSLMCIYFLLAFSRCSRSLVFENPVFLTGYGAYGGGFQKQSGDVGYGGALIFRPGSPINIFDGFLNWTTGMVVQIDYLKVQDGGDITSLDLIMRRYFKNRGDRKTEVNIFLGLGSGISEIQRPDANDISGGDHWSILAEAGQEWFFKPTHMLFLKGQYRWMINAGRTYRTWSVLVGSGLAWP